MTPDSPLHRALTAWRVAERRLSMTGVDDPSRPSLVAEVERRRLAYQTQFDAVEDVAGHGAPYADDEPTRRGRARRRSIHDRRRAGGQRQQLTPAGCGGQPRGGPASIRRRSAVASADQSASIHHVAPASAWSRAVSAAASGRRPASCRRRRCRTGPSGPRAPGCRRASRRSRPAPRARPGSRPDRSPGPRHRPSERPGASTARGATRRRPRPGSAAAGRASGGTSSRRTGNGRPRTRTARRTTGRRGWPASRRGAGRGGASR